MVAARQAEDRWFGADKLRHFFASYGVTAVSYGGARLAGIERESSLSVSVAAAVVAGIGKEWVDVRRGGPFSFRDLMYDAAGIAVAIGILHSTN